MSVAAVMLVRDEADILGYILDYLETQVDRIYAYDNRSVDATASILKARASVVYRLDEQVGYWQSRKTSRLAGTALKDGFQWVVPVDADEIWEAPDERRLGDYLDGVAPNVQVVSAELFDYMPTGVDDPLDPDPLRRIQWRLPQPGTLPKVAARAHGNLKIHPGNHGADYGGAPFAIVSGLKVRHFSWRTEEQYLRKIRNGVEAYRETDLRPAIGQHWRMWEGHDDEAILEHYRTWFCPADPEQAGLVHDPWRP